MDLSIGMIMKNEEKYLRDCLNGLKPILEQVHSELIIYDTGSTDASVEIAKEFTDKVFQIEWRGDFAWARNHTLDRAIGKWYMFLDADEVFTDTADIIEFFNSGEYKKYKSATYRLKNQQTDTVSVEFSPRRMFKKDKDTRFFGKIHEYIVPKIPIKSLQSIATHFGYYFTGPDAQEKMQKKRDRNTKSLLELYEENPNDKRTLYHLVNEYHNFEPDEALRYFTKGLDLTGTNQNDIYYHVFTTQRVNHFAAKSDWEEVLNITRAYFKDLTVEYLNVIQLRFVQAQAYLSLGRYAEAAEAYVQSYAYFKKNKAGKLDHEITTILPLNTSIIESEPLHVSGVVSYYGMAGDFDKSFEYYNRYKKESGTDPQLDIIKKCVTSFAQESLWTGFAKLFAYGYKQGEGTEIYNQAINEIETALTDNLMKQEVATAILNDETTGDLDTDYIWLQKLRMDNDEALDYFMEANKPFSYHYGDVLVAAMKSGKDITQFLSNIEIANTPIFINRLYTSHHDFFNILFAYMQNNYTFLSNCGIKAIRILADITQAAFIVSEKNEALAVKLRIDLFEIAIRLRHRFLSMVYRDNVYNAETIDALSDRDRVTFYANNAYDCRNQGDIIEGFIQNMNRVLTIEPEMKNIVMLVCASMMGTPAPAPVINQETADEITTLKKSIHDLIESKDVLKATQLLRDYASLNPTDPEIKNIQTSIREAMKVI